LSFETLENQKSACAVKV